MAKFKIHAKQKDSDTKFFFYDNMTSELTDESGNYVVRPS